VLLRHLELECEAEELRLVVSSGLASLRKAWE